MDEKKETGKLLTRAVEKKNIKNSEIKTTINLQQTGYALNYLKEEYNGREIPKLLCFLCCGFSFLILACLSLLEHKTRMI